MSTGDEGTIRGIQLHNIPRERGEWATGYFVHARFKNGRYEPVDAPFICAKPAAYDGAVIHRTSGDVLVPHGRVEYPLEPGHGKRINYQMGKQVGVEEEY